MIKKERLPKKARERYQSLPKEEKGKKRDNIVIAYRKTAGLEVDCYVLLFLKVC